MLTPYENDKIETVALSQCRTCEAELRVHDKFCRRCGVRQTRSLSASTGEMYPSWCETRALASDADAYTTYSSQLIRVVTESLSARGSTQGSGLGQRRLIFTLIAIPLWMLIVMLSPLDAYAAARAAARYVE